MNTIEKRKLEGVVISKLQKARENYKSRRELEISTLVESLRDNPPKEVELLVAQRIKLEADYKKQKTQIETKASALGYEIDTNYDKEVTLNLDRRFIEGANRYTAPELQTHSKETSLNLEKLDNLMTDYTMSIWSESGDMEKLLEKFQTDLKAIVK